MHKNKTKKHKQSGQKSLFTSRCVTTPQTESSLSHACVQYNTGTKITLAPLCCYCIEETATGLSYRAHRGGPGSICHATPSSSAEKRCPSCCSWRFHKAPRESGYKTQSCWCVPKQRYRAACDRKCAEQRSSKHFMGSSFYISPLIKRILLSVQKHKQQECGFTVTHRDTQSITIEQRRKGVSDLTPPRREQQRYTDCDIFV